MSSQLVAPLRRLHGQCGRYRLIARIDGGGMANVDLAIPEDAHSMADLVVLKRLSADAASNQRLRRMFFEEGWLASRLVHPNVVATQGMGQSGDEHFIVMEYLDGQPLVRLLRRSRPDGLPIIAALGIVSDVCAGLHYVHQLADDSGSPLGVVHRDVSPENIFVTTSGQVKLVDFGVARTARTERTEAGTVKGKPAYMSPEQAEGEDVDRRSDVFSLGIVLYEAVTRRRLWGKAAAEGVILRRLSAGDIPSSPRALEPQVPEAVDQICRRALAPEPQDRYATAHEMRVDLVCAIASLGGRFPPHALGEMVQDLFWLERRKLATALEEAPYDVSTKEQLEEQLEEQLDESATVDETVPLGGASATDTMDGVRTIVERTLVEGTAPKPSRRGDSAANSASPVERTSSGSGSHPAAGAEPALADGAAVQHDQGVREPAERVGPSTTQDGLSCPNDTAFPEDTDVDGTFIRLQARSRRRKKALAAIAALGATLGLLLGLTSQRSARNSDALLGATRAGVVAGPISSVELSSLSAGNREQAESPDSAAAPRVVFLSLGSTTSSSASPSSSAPSETAATVTGRSGGSSRANRPLVRSPRSNQGACSVSASSAQRLANCGALSDRR